jgi:hypothetical protein
MEIFRVEWAAGSWQSSTVINVEVTIIDQRVRDN